MGLFQNDNLLVNSKATMSRIAMKFVKAHRMEGDYLEFGVSSGNSFCASYLAAKRLDLTSMNFYAFDSFKGLPQPRGIDADQEGGCHEGLFAYSKDEFVKNILSCGVDLKRVEIIAGWFNQTLNQEQREKLPIKKASVIWVDCDLYESTTAVLDYILDYIQNGTILVFDGWFAFRGNPDRGAQKSFREWLIKNPFIRAIEFRKFGWHGNSFILRIDNKS